MTADPVDITWRKSTSQAGPVSPQNHENTMGFGGGVLVRGVEVSILTFF